MKLWPVALAVVVLAACAPKPPPPKPAPTPATDGPRPAPNAAPSAAAAADDAGAPPDVGGCNEDRGPVPDCTGLSLGHCGAAEYYACPAKVGLPVEAGLRPQVAARVSACLARPTFDGSTSACTKTVEACVREAVSASCTEDETVVTCKVGSPGTELEFAL